jgi:hypothetical protein
VSIAELVGLRNSERQLRNGIRYHKKPGLKFADATDQVFV